MKTVAESTSDPDVDDDGEAAGLRLDGRRVSKARSAVEARWGDTLVHVNTFDVRSDRARSAFAKSVVEKVAEQFQVEIEPAAIDRELMAIADHMAAADREHAAAAAGAAEYWAVADGDDPERSGIYRRTAAGEARLTNFTMAVERDVVIHDDVQGEARFEGTIRLHGREHPFAIAAASYADNRQLLAAVYAAAGSQARVLAQPGLLRDAVSALGEPARVERTTNFGWTADNTAYLAQRGLVTAEGFFKYRDDDVRVDLAGEQWAKWLDLRGLNPGRRAAVRRHIAADLLQLHDRTVTYSLMGAVALAPLFRFVEGMNRFALWLRGITGEGKSFLARLAQNFFGDFPVELGARVGSWTSTVNTLQRQGYFHRDAVYTVDDYKAENVRHHEVVRLLQNYADGSARGRLNADSSSKPTREIRGLLVATGEDIPEHSAGAVARSVVVDLPRRPKDIARGRRCLANRQYYRGVMADFLRWTIAEERPQAFRERVLALQEAYFRDIAGSQNDLRIASNFALLAAAFEEFAAYLGPDWPEGEAEAAAYVQELLPALRNRMVGTVREQQASEVFLDELRTLIATRKVRLAGLAAGTGGEDKSGHVPLVGGMAAAAMTAKFPAAGANAVVEVSLSRALGEVQKSLADQRRPPLAANEQALAAQLCADGLLLDAAGEALAPDFEGPKTYNRRIEGGQLRVARFPRAVLLGEVPRTKAPDPKKG